MEPVDYLPVEYIFQLASSLRNGVGKTPQAALLTLRRRKLRSLDGLAPVEQVKIPRASFWLRLCQTAALLDESPLPVPTLLFEQWLGWPLQAQIGHLLKAWLNQPGELKWRQMRRDIFQRIERGQPLNSAQRKDLVILQALGICHGGVFSALGSALLNLSGSSQAAVLKTEAWQIQEEKLVIPFPPDWKLLWELEKYIDPDRHENYALDAKSLKRAVQRGAAQNSPGLDEIIQKGLRDRSPVWITKRLVIRLPVRLVPGYLLEFEEGNVLKHLRQNASLRNELERVISPRHVNLEPFRGMQVLKKLYRKGLLAEADYLACCDSNPEQEEPPGLPGRADRAFLLSLVLLCKALDPELSWPTGLLERLSQNLGPDLCGAAAGQATRLLNKLRPASGWYAEPESPTPPSPSLSEKLQEVIDRQDSIDVLYRATVRHSAEVRHLSPLLLEQRSGRSYLLAYCHTRRANRTFRLDRLQLVED